VATAAEPRQALVTVRDLTLAFGDFVLMRRLDFEVRQGAVFIVMGASGSGKSVLLRNMVGLLEPAHGEVYYRDQSFTRAGPTERDRMLRRIGILYQRNALWSSMTLTENVSLPLREYTDLSDADVREVARLKLALVGLRGFEEYLPNAISGGMQKRAALARAMALDPEVLFFDEPSSGLDPLTARRLDDLMLELRASLGTTLVVVSHDLASILTIGDDSILLDTDAKTAIAAGHPRELLAHSHDPRVRRFLTRGAEGAPDPGGAAASQGPSPARPRMERTP
jgi:phospholipid/cholesterol/gamma-HCH transport system ATP-binding protein